MDYLYIPDSMVSREPYKGMSLAAKWLFVTLKYLEQRHDTDGKGFIRTNEELSADMGVSLATIKRAKAELLATNLVKMEKTHNLCHYKRLK